MSPSGLTAFDNTLQTTHIWMNEVMEQLGWEDTHRAYLALRTVLQALRDRLPVDEATDLGSQLPMLVRGFYYEGWHPSKTPVKERRQEEFLEPMQSAFRNAPDIDAKEVTQAVFQVLCHHVTESNIRHVVSSLPAGIRELWPEEATV